MQIKNQMEMARRAVVVVVPAPNGVRAAIGSRNLGWIYKLNFAHCPYFTNTHIFLAPPLLKQASNYYCNYDCN